VSSRVLVLSVHCRPPTPMESTIGSSGNICPSAHDKFSLKSLTELRISVNEFQRSLWGDLTVIQERANPSQEHLSRNLEIKGLAEMAGFTRFFHDKYQDEYIRRDRGLFCRDVPALVPHFSRPVPAVQTME